MNYSTEFLACKHEKYISKRERESSIIILFLLPLMLTGSYGPLSSSWCVHRFLLSCLLSYFTWITVPSFPFICPFLPVFFKTSKRNTVPITRSLTSSNEQLWLNVWYFHSISIYSNIYGKTIFPHTTYWKWKVSL